MKGNTRKNGKRIISIILSLVMMLSSFGIAAAAADTLTWKSCGTNVSLAVDGTTLKFRVDDGTDGYLTNGVQFVTLLPYDYNRITAIEAVGSGTVHVGQTASFMFGGRYNGMVRAFTALENIDGLSMWETSNVRTMENMFFYCKSLTNLDALSEWDTSNVANLQNIFSDCMSLVNIDGLANWDTSNVTNMQGIFSSCPSMTNVDALANWQTGNVTNLSFAFSNNGIKNVDGLRKWDTRSNTTLSYAFYGDRYLENIDGLLKWNMGNVTNLTATFFACQNLESLDGLARWNTSNVTTLNNTFNGCGKLEDLDGLLSWDTGNVTDMDYTFFRCFKLENIDGLVDWDTSNVTSLSSTFNGCGSLKNLNGIENWNVENVSHLTQTFIDCSSLIDFDLSKWNFDYGVSVDSINHPFMKLKRIGIPQGISSQYFGNFLYSYLGYSEESGPLSPVWHKVGTNTQVSFDEMTSYWTDLINSLGSVWVALPEVSDALTVTPIGNIGAAQLNLLQGDQGTQGVLNLLQAPRRAMRVVRNIWNVDGVVFTIDGERTSNIKDHAEYKTQRFLYSDEADLIDVTWYRVDETDPTLETVTELADGVIPSEPGRYRAKVDIYGTVDEDGYRFVSMSKTNGKENDLIIAAHGVTYHYPGVRPHDTEPPAHDELAGHPDGVFYRAVMPAEPTGYTFGGWYKSFTINDNGEEIFEEPFLTSGENTQAAESTIRDADMAREMTSYTAPVTNANGKISSGYKINGAADETDENENNDSELFYGGFVKDHLDLYGKWTRKTTALTVKTLGEEKSVTATYDEEIPEITVPNIYGYEFSGYKTDDGKVYLDADGNKSLWDKTDDEATLTADLRAYVITVNYPDGTSVELTVDTDTDTLARPETTPELEGHTFTGYRVKGSNIEIDADGKLDRDLFWFGADGTVELEAVFDRNCYNIEFYHDDEKLHDDKIEVYHGDEVLSPYEAGYTLIDDENHYVFRGWTTELKENFDEIELHNLDEITDHAVLYAVFEGGEHTYKLDTERSNDATCTEDGLKVEVCPDCGHERQTVLEATDHNFVGGDRTKMKDHANCSHGNLYFNKCANSCGLYSCDPSFGGKYIDTEYWDDGEKIPSAHKFTGTADCAHGQICEWCGIEGKTNDTNHVEPYTYDVGKKAATCTAAGYSGDTVCAEGHIVTKGSTIKATGHVDEDKDGKCDKCGEIDRDHHEHEDKNGDDLCDKCGYDMSMSIADCHCICHKALHSKFYKVLYKISLAFWRLFKVRRVCDCKQWHYFDGGLNYKG